MVSEDGSLQLGHSKDHRPDLPQLKVMLATLDPLGLPLASEVLSGERADDPLYLPVIARVRACLNTPGLLYVGDCKMAALETRAGIQAHDDYYLCPLSAVQVSADQLARELVALQESSQPLLTVERTGPMGRRTALRSAMNASRPSQRSWRGCRTRGWNDGCWCSRWSQPRRPNSPCGGD